ncbi:DoxX family membrane protein [bacterium]|nr:DoxX family membrane protein [bacterium]
MAEANFDGPLWVRAILTWRGTWILARIVLTSAYWTGGIYKLSDLPGAVAEQAHFGLQPPAFWALVTIAVELGGSALVILGRTVWLGAGALGVLTAVAMLLANDFWTMQGVARFTAFNAFFEHAGLIAGFVLTAILAIRPAEGRR